MKTFIAFCFLLISLPVFPCGADWDEEDEYYGMFQQLKMYSEEQELFLKTYQRAFYDGYSYEMHDGNVKLWLKLFPYLPSQHIHNLLTVDSARFEELWKPKLNNKQKAARTYLEYARKCSRFFEYRRVVSWDYNDIVKEKVVDVSEILETGMNYYNNETIPVLKQRYGYQIVRILHYGKRYQEAVDFFEAEIKGNEPNEIYYYTLDQYSGCLYSLERYEEAAFGFLRVIDKSMDRKRSAFLSYRLCIDKNATGKELIKTDEDLSTFIFVESFLDFSLEYNPLEKLFQLNPNSHKVKNTFARSVNSLERNLLADFSYPTKKHIDPFEDTLRLREVKQLLNFCKKAQNQTDVIDKEYWLVSETYLHFLNANLEKATQLIKQIEGTTYQDQKVILEKLYTIFQWSEIGQKEEELLGTLFNTDNVRFPLLNICRDLIQEYASHLYLKQGDIAKNFLIHNELSLMKVIRSLELITAVRTLLTKEEKTRYEHYLARRAHVSYYYRDNRLAFLDVLEANYYLSKNKIQKAHTIYSKLEKNGYAQRVRYTIPSVPAAIFSNKLIIHYDTDAPMEDSVYLAPLFSFITDSMNMKQFTACLLRLKKMTREGKKWERKLAHYLLANYYNNASNTGYYRQVVQNYEDNCCNGFYLGNGDRFYSVPYETYMGFADYANHHYQKTIALSNDDELNARCYFLIAQCEQNDWVNNRENWLNNYKDRSESFDPIEEKYRHTKFYKKAMSCSYFKYYVSM